MQLLESLPSYGRSWEEVSREPLSNDELFLAITKAEVVEKEQKWGISTSICLFMKSGATKFIPLSRDSDLEVGDQVDLDSIEVIGLERDDEVIYRADGEKVSKKRR